MNNIKALAGILQELNYILDRRQKKTAMLIFLASVVNSGFELIGVAIILPFIEMVENPEKLMSKDIIIKIMNILSIKEPKALLLMICVAIIVVYLLKSAYMIFFLWIQSDYTSSFSKEMATKTLRAYLNHPYIYFTNVNSSDILNGCGADIDGVSLVISCIFNIISSVITILVLGGYLIITDVVTSIAMIIVMGILMVSIIATIKPVMKRVGAEAVSASKAKNVALLQVVEGIKEIFVSQKQDFFYRRYEEAYEQNRILGRKYEFLNGVPAKLIEGICASGIILIVGVRIVSGMDSTSSDFLPKLAIFAMAAFRMFPAVSLVINRINAIVYARPRVRNVYNNYKESQEYIKNFADKVSAEGVDENIQTIGFENSVSVNNIFWRYPDQPEEVLHDISLNIKKGESVAFIGSSGAGKTTLVDIIMGLFSPNKGTIAMDGTDITTIPKTWAKYVSYVPQSVFIIDDNVKANVVFGVENEEISEEKVWECLKDAQLYDFVKGLPDELNTRVGERGVKFSGGQRQRIAIARALYSSPEILVLDEATAALDSETEKAIMESIDNLKGKVTLIIIAHRLTTVKNCDHIYEVKDKKLIERDKEELFSNL